MDQHPWRLGPRSRRWFDRLLVTGLLLLAAGHVVAGQPASAFFSVAEMLPLLWRRRHAWPVFLAVAAVSAVQAFAVDEPTVGQLAFPVAVYSVARWSPRWRSSRSPSTSGASNNWPPQCAPARGCAMCSLRSGRRPCR